MHIPLSQLITADCTIQEGKWGNSAIVTRYRLDSQFHCSHLDSRGVPEKTREKNRGKLSPFHFRFTTSGSVTSFPVAQLPVAHAHTITSGSTP